MLCACATLALLSLVSPALYQPLSYERIFVHPRLDVAQSHDPCKGGERISAAEPPIGTGAVVGCGTKEAEFKKTKHVPLRETYINRLALPESALDSEQVSMQVVPLGPLGERQ